MASAQNQVYKAALNWYVDNGVDIALLDEPLDRTKIKPPVSVKANVVSAQPLPQHEPLTQPRSKTTPVAPVPLGASDAHSEAVKLAAAANTLDELRDAIASFEGLPLKKTATNLVFSDGNPKADIMVIGDAPGADEDRIGKPFAGETGQLLDKILACIDLDRNETDPTKSCYLANIINWRPPGNRTPSASEVEVSLPFIERQIQFVVPKVIIFTGAISAKALLGRSDGISRMRKSWYEYTPQTAELKSDAEPIAAIATYHPAYLLKTPAQKRAVWDDMLMVQKKLSDETV